jgi:hypothetical protein
MQEGPGGKSRVEGNPKESPASFMMTRIESRLPFRLDRFFSPEIILDDQEGLLMRTLSIMVVMALLIVPAISQPTWVGGNFGDTWLAQYGNKNVVKQSSGLWSWGTIPKGQMLSNGKLTELSPGTVFFPAFLTNTTPIILNAMTPGEAIRRSNLSQISNPYLTEDPWFVAQTADQPVFFRQLPY